MLKRRKRKSGQPTGRKTLALHKVGAQLLSTRDYELVSIAQIAKLAGSSVGAFYERWQDKDHFLRMTIERTLRQAMGDAERELDPARLARTGNLQRRIREPTNQPTKQGCFVAAQLKSECPQCATSRSFQVIGTNVGESPKTVHHRVGLLRFPWRSSR